MQSANETISDPPKSVKSVHESNPSGRIDTLRTHFDRDKENTSCSGKQVNDFSLMWSIKVTAAEVRGWGGFIYDQQTVGHFISPRVWSRQSPNFLAGLDFHRRKKKLTFGRWRRRLIIESLDPNTCVSFLFFFVLNFCFVLCAFVFFVVAFCFKWSTWRTRLASGSSHSAGNYAFSVARETIKEK